MLIGCGQLGSRHLQALATLNGVDRIDVVDPYAPSLDRGRELLQEVKGANPDIRYRWLTSLSEAGDAGALCVVATQAEGREVFVEQALAKGYRRFLLEKVVCQSLSRYERLLDSVSGHGALAWVNCKTRAYPFWKYVKEKLEDSIFEYYVSIGNYGLANTGVHLADIFVHLDGCERIEPVGADLDPVLHPSKRGNRVFDLSGSVFGRSERGSRLAMDFAGHHKLPGTIQVTSPEHRFLVNQVTRQAFEASPSTNWKFEPVPFEGDLMVSAMTREFARDILDRGQCGLPTLEECHPAHAFIFSLILPTMNKLLGKDDDICPVT